MASGGPVGFSISYWIARIKAGHDPYTDTLRNPYEVPRKIY